MAHTTSQLQTKLSTEAQNNEGLPWSSLEAAVELILNKLGAVTVTSESTAEATAAAPAYIEGQDAPLSQNLVGQLRVLAALAAGTALIGKVGIDQTTPGTTNAVQLTGAQLTPVTSTVSTDGTVAAGKYSVEFIFSSDFAGTILTVAYAGANDAVKSFDAPAGRTLAAIAYTISAGSARLTTI